MPRDRHSGHARQLSGERLDDLDLMAQLVTLYMAGHEPTAVLIGNGTLALTRNPDQLHKLRSDRSLMLNAISELLRFDGPNQFTRRITTQPTALSDIELPAGAVVYAGLASANRDPRFWGEDSEFVVVDRHNASKHLQFGAGVHACLGSHLARLQAEVAFTARDASARGKGAGCSDPVSNGMRQTSSTDRVVSRNAGRASMRIHSCAGTKCVAFLQNPDPRSHTITWRIGTSDGTSSVGSRERLPPMIGLWL